MGRARSRAEKPRAKGGGGFVPGVSQDRPSVKKRRGGTGPHETAWSEMGLRPHQQAGARRWARAPAEAGEAGPEARPAGRSDRQRRGPQSPLRLSSAGVLPQARGAGLAVAPGAAVGKGLAAVRARVERTHEVLQLQDGREGLGVVEDGGPNRLARGVVCWLEDHNGRTKATTLEMQQNVISRMEHHRIEGADLVDKAV